MRLPSGLFRSGFPTKSLMLLSFPHTCYMAHHRILHDLITRLIVGEDWILLSCSLCSLLKSPVISSLLGPDILLFPTSSTYVSLLYVSDQFSRPYKTIGKTIVLYALGSCDRTS